MLNPKRVHKECVCRLLHTCEMFKQSKTKWVIVCIHVTDGYSAGRILPVDHLCAV